MNITSDQMDQGVVSRTITKALHDNDLPGSSLCLELTESVLVKGDAAMERFLDNVRTRGIRLSIDDCGTGYSSLAYLTKLPVQELKIDRGFITGLPGNRADMTVVASVVALAHQLGMAALAEGVETDEQLSTVRRLGCDLIQGYLLGRADSVDGVGRFLTDAPVRI